MEFLLAMLLGALVVTSKVAPTGICGAAMRPLNAATPAKEVTPANEVTKGWSVAAVAAPASEGAGGAMAPDTKMGAAFGSAFKTGDAFRVSNLIVSTIPPPPAPPPPPPPPPPPFPRNDDRNTKELAPGGASGWVKRAPGWAAPVLSRRRADEGAVK